LEQFLEDVEFEILAMLKRGNEDYAPSPRSKAVNGLLANLQGQDQVVVPTDKTNSFRLVDSTDYIRWVKAHLNASAKVFLVTILWKSFNLARISWTKWKV
jgi:hypothetical protein